jgi:hypothetical protein
MFDFDVISGPAPSRDDRETAVRKEPSKDRPETTREAPAKPAN